MVISSEILSFIFLLLNYSSGKWKHVCAGSIINEWTIITAAHCVNHFFSREYSSIFRILPGLHIANLPYVKQSLSEWNTPLHEIHQIYRTRDYNFTTFHHDLALVTVKTPFVFNERIKPVKLDFESSRSNELEGNKKIF